MNKEKIENKRIMNKLCARKAKELVRSVNQVDCTYSSISKRIMKLFFFFFMKKKCIYKSYKKTILFQPT